MPSTTRDPYDSPLVARERTARLTFPTRYKSKLPNTLSWPVGAEAVTAGLGDAPHAAACGLWFHASPVWRASAFRQMLREARPYAILVAEYRPAERIPYSHCKAMDAAGLYDAKWQVHVYPVPRPWRAAAGALLREHGLPAVATWLRTLTGTAWQARHHRLELVFAPAEGTLSAKSIDGV